MSDDTADIREKGKKHKTPLEIQFSIQCSNGPQRRTVMMFFFLTVA